MSISLGVPRQAGHRRGGSFTRTRCKELWCFFGSCPCGLLVSDLKQFPGGPCSHVREFLNHVQGFDEVISI